MRPFVGFMFVLALAASPLNVSAQEGEAQPRTADGYTIEEMDVRVRRAGIGLGVSSAVLATGGVLLGLGAAQANVATGEKFGLLGAGIGLTFVGVVTTITTGVMLRHRKRDRDSLRQAHYGTPRRAQWDLAHSRLVF
jgi:hypothetical protein